MKTFPASPDLASLERQAELRLADMLGNAAPASLRDLMLNDARFAIARDYGFRSWTELTQYCLCKGAGEPLRLGQWLTWVYEGNKRERGFALRALDEEPELAAGDPWLACAIGDEARLQEALARDPAWVNRAGGFLAMPPLVAVTHSRLLQEPGFEARLIACAALLLRRGADVDCRWTDKRWPDSPLSALYGAAGRNHHAVMTRLLLEAGANPNDNESLYHSLETPDPACTLLLLEAGAQVPGTNALGRVLDYDKLELLELLLRHGGDARERPWIHHAIRRGRSLAHIRALADAGADLRACDNDGVSLYRLAQMRGRTDVVDMLEAQGIQEPLTEEERFVAACARGDADTARAIKEQLPDIFARLDERQLQALPAMAETGGLGGVATMLALGWPREVKAEWEATALNLAIFRGDARMTEVLMAAGADWRTRHGYDGNAIGTLAFASQAEGIDEPVPRDDAGCAEALVRHGVPLGEFEDYTFSAEVTDRLDALRRAASQQVPPTARP